MSKIIGACVFRNDGDGCLSSKYVNEHTTPFGESCKLIHGSRPVGSTDVFEGTYNTVWLESAGGTINHQVTELQINLRRDGTYELFWTNPTYRGIGMSYGGLLVATYWS